MEEKQGVLTQYQQDRLRNLDVIIDGKVHGEIGGSTERWTFYREEEWSLSITFKADGTADVFAWKVPPKVFAAVFERVSAHQMAKTISHAKQR